VVWGVELGAPSPCTSLDGISVELAEHNRGLGLVAGGARCYFRGILLNLAGRVSRRSPAGYILRPVSGGFLTKQFHFLFFYLGFSLVGLFVFGLVERVKSRLLKCQPPVSLFSIFEVPA
jgi:hypothetical protein